MAINPTGTNGASLLSRTLSHNRSRRTPSAISAPITLLDCLATIDRFSDSTIDIGGGARDINKLRIAGRININTASGDILRAIPNMTDQMVANILSYRSRNPGSGVPLTISYNAVPSNLSGVFQGTGIHSLAELLAPLATAPGIINPDPASGATSRDKLWASVYNLCTVSSDTFVVYGYLEAIRVHPNVVALGLHDNKYSWYDESGANTPFTISSATDVATTDDPHATTTTYPNLRNLRVARRRWVAIVDRSWSNTTKTIVPRIVAMKDLPQ